VKAGAFCFPLIIFIQSCFMKKNIVFIARSLDGLIAGKNGELDWLHSIPNPDNIDMGFTDLMNEVDAIVMGRTTYETVIGFGVDWPYSKHVFVLSNSIKEIQNNLKDRVTLLSGELNSILTTINNKGYNTLYIDGGTTIQNFLKEDLIDELRITTIPILLGGGFPLFGELDQPLEFDHLESKVFLDQIVQDTYRRKR
jgi:dihydrofolate reductase